ncbi:MAG TPA: EAL domain-containing protein [Gemmatimonadota bacterium]|nr:EAL domain-containing protein [Gemmatimonadota bacterium]
MDPEISSPDATAREVSGPTPVAGHEESSHGRSRLYRLLHHPVRPIALLVLAAFLALAVLWTATWNLGRVEHENARETAETTSRELLDTYEAQVFRVLQQMDQTLRSVQYAVQLRGDGRTAFDDLNDRDLLPPDLIFVVSVTDHDGNLVATNGASLLAGDADDDILDLARESHSLVVGQPVAVGDEWRLPVGRRLTAPDGSFGGVATVEVDPTFFVSGYEVSRLGRDGVVGILGQDGVFRARRSGDDVTVGGRTDYESVVTEQGFGDTRTVLSTNEWDGVRRYTSARELYGFPVAVVVGISENEALAPADDRTSTYVARAGMASLLLILIAGVLAWMSWKLDRVRRREGEAQVAHARRVEHLAYHDSLTGLPNRSFLGRLLEDRVRLAGRYGQQFAVLFLDLDGFKQINDTLGHDAGDDLLREVAERLEATLRDSDVVARMGGDEFVVLLPTIANADQVASVAQKVIDSLAQPFVLLGEQFTVTASVGVSLYPQDGADVQALMKNADIAMYEAKEAGKKAFRFFSQWMGSESRERLDLEVSLRQALVRQEFELHYQARRDLDSGRITGMEALLRWEHPRLGTVKPAKFLPLAEETGLILPIGKWVLRTACRQNVAWLADGLPRLSVAVNLSAAQFFDPDLLDVVASALEDSDMDPELLELEICESILARDTFKTVPILEDLKRLGTRITVDNFGTGYSSLTVLRGLPLDTIKIDRLFLRADAGNAMAHEVTDALVAMGRSLSSSVVVHGVETREQVDYLRSHACHQVQGFFFDRPSRATDIAVLLRGELVTAPSQESF